MEKGPGRIAVTAHTFGDICARLPRHSLRSASMHTSVAPRCRTQISSKSVAVTRVVTGYGV